MDYYRLGVYIYTETNPELEIDKDNREKRELKSSEGVRGARNSSLRKKKPKEKDSIGETSKIPE